MKISRNQINSVTSLRPKGDGRLVLEGNPLDCDCKAENLREVLTNPDSYVVPNSIACNQQDSQQSDLKEAPRSSKSSFFKSPSSKVLLQDFPISSLSCPLTSGCPRRCKCTRAPGLVTVDCRY